MRTLLLFIGSVLYPVVMVIISPVLLTLYFLFACVLVSRYLNWLRHQALLAISNLKLPLAHLPAKKVLVFRPKAVRWH